MKGEDLDGFGTKECSRLRMGVNKILSPPQNKPKTLRSLVFWHVTVDLAKWLSVDLAGYQYSVDLASYGRFGRPL